MNEKLIDRVSKILEEWNPLGEKSITIEDLDGYRTEAIDILSTSKIVFKGNVEKAVKEVLEQAFNIIIDPKEAEEAATKIKLILKDYK